MPRSKRFTQDELNFIHENYKHLSVQDIASNLKRSTKSVRHKIEQLGLKLSKLKRNRPYVWTDEEINILKENYALPDHEIQRLLPKATISMITRKRLELNLRKHKYEPFLQNEYYQVFRNGKRVWVHKDVAEQKIGRKLHENEVVHHVNGDKIDNDPENLFVCSSKKHHGLVHANLEQVAFQLVKEGVIKFNHSIGKYYFE